MKNGRVSVARLRREMLGRFDDIQKSFSADLRRLEKNFTRRVGGIKTNVKALFDVVGALDHEIKEHKRDKRIHSS